MSEQDKNVTKNVGNNENKNESKSEFKVVSKDDGKAFSSAKKTFLGLVIFAIVCILITAACIYMTLTNKENGPLPEIFTQKPMADEKYEPVKLTDKSHLNPIKEVEKKESYGDIIDYYSYDDSVIRKLDVTYVQIEGLKNKEIQDKINTQIREKINEYKEDLVPMLKDKDIERMWISASVIGNFADVISINAEKYIYYNYDDEDYENDKSESEVCGLNYSLATGEEIKFNDLFWKGSPIKNILSQSLYKEVAKEYANEVEEMWDMDFDNVDYSVIEPKVFKFMDQYNKNPDVDFYFTYSNIEFIPKDNNSYSYSIQMADFYEYISIYTKYKSNNLYEDESNMSEFYVFGNPYLASETVKEDTVSNAYYVIYCYDTEENMDDEAKKVSKIAKDAVTKRIEEYLKEVGIDKEYGYMIEAYYNETEYQEYEWDDNQYGYNFNLEISRCPIKYFEEHLEDVLAAGARAPRYDVGPIGYEYIDDNFEFYETYSEWVSDYTDEDSKHISVYTKEERDRDEEEWKRQEEEGTTEIIETIEEETVIEEDA